MVLLILKDLLTITVILSFHDIHGKEMDNWQWAMTFDPLHMCEDRKTYAFISGYNAGTLFQNLCLLFLMYTHRDTNTIYTVVHSQTLSKHKIYCGPQSDFRDNLQTQYILWSTVRL